jgi:hypothetical protein
MNIQINALHGIGIRDTPFCVLNLDEMNVKSPCLEAFEKYNGDVHA